MMDSELRTQRQTLSSDLQAEVAHHPERLWRGDLVDQVGADEELSLAIGQLTHRVGVPNFLEETLAHGVERTVGGGEKNAAPEPGRRMRQNSTGEGPRITEIGGSEKGKGLLDLPHTLCKMNSVTPHTHPIST